jgi:hypothetical protein
MHRLTKCLELGEDTTSPAQDARAGDSEGGLGPRPVLDPRRSRQARPRTGRAAWFGLRVAEVKDDVPESLFLGGKSSVRIGGAGGDEVSGARVAEVSGTLGTTNGTRQARDSSNYEVSDTSLPGHLVSPAVCTVPEAARSGRPIRQLIRHQAADEVSDIS